MKELINLTALSLIATLLSPTAFANDASSKVVAASDIEWGYLNPLRGDKSPGAADLWGDRTSDSATGMLVRFNKGFESPPHIHNITYRGIVIKGQMHNDDPNAEKLWMPTGSFWTQPAGEDHTTAANSDANLIYLEIDSGPYLVKPSKQKFDNGERSLNLHRDNIVWLNPSDLNNIKADGVGSAYVWVSTAGMNGSLLKLAVGFKGEITTSASEFRAVVIAGAVEYNSKEQKESLNLNPGSYLESTGQFTHTIANNSDTESIIYIRTNVRYQIK